MNERVNASIEMAKSRVKNLNKRVEFVASTIEDTLGKAGIDTKGIESQAKTMVVFIEEIVKDTMATTITKAGRLKDIYLTDIDMEEIPLKAKKLENFKGEIPKYESKFASGFDVRAQIDGDAIILAPGERRLVSTGLSFEIPEGFEIQARPRSGLAIKHGISLVNTPGTIDADYRGEVKIILINHGIEPFEIKDQARIAQLVLCPIFQAQFHWVEELEESDRGDCGFGSTGQ